MSILNYGASPKDVVTHFISANSVVNCMKVWICVFVIHLNHTYLQNMGSMCRSIFFFFPCWPFLTTDLQETWQKGWSYSPLLRLLSLTTRSTLFEGVTMERQMSLLKDGFPWQCCHVVKAAWLLHLFWGEEREKWLGLWVTICSF